MNDTNQKNMSSLIWDVADILWGPFKKSEYGRIILPFTVLRRLECVMESKRTAVFDVYNRTKNTADDIVLDRKLKIVAGELNQPALFYNTSQFTLANLNTTDAAIQLMQYVGSFNPDIVEVFENFEFQKWVDKLVETDVLHAVIDKFKTYDLSFARYDNHDMGTIFEELIRKFSESANDTAGEFFTPRDVVQLTTELTFAHADRVFTTDDNISIYDPTVGGGGFLTVGNDILKSKGRDEYVSLYGQEVNGESYAMCRADMTMLGHTPEHIKKGDTLRIDLFNTMQFDFCLSNPPYGADWKKIKTDIEAEHAKGYAGRFGAGIPRVSDGSMLFLQHIIAKMDDDTGTAGIVLSGSPLFTGGAGSGESEIRRHILENDYVDAIIALPGNLFYNTSIATYIWILSKNKRAERQGKVILINAMDKWQPMRKSLGDKRREISPDQRREIIKLYMDYTETEHSKIFNTTDFGYRRITVERPLQLKFTPTDGDALKKLVGEKSLITWANKQDIDPDEFIHAIGNIKSEYPSETEFLADIKRATGQAKIPTNIIKLFRKHLGHHDETADYITDNQGNKYPNPDLRDAENIPLGTDINHYFQREVTPHIPDAWIDTTKTDPKDGKIGMVGYEISFNRYFYQYQPPRPLNEIESEIKQLETEILDLLGGVTE